MHKSRLGGFIIDCRTESLDAAAGFWSQALGFEAGSSGDPSDANYRFLRTDRDDLYVEVQQVTQASGVHIDIETDDVAAEVRRLESLGAQKIRVVRDWCVMQAPTGQRFCVVPVQGAGFDQKSNSWE